ncbi:hypothetical protein AB3S75_016204 [Citrus x aurantiifolia]
MNFMHSKKEVPPKLANQLPIVLHVVKFCKLLMCNGIDCTLHSLGDSAYHGIKKLPDVGCRKFGHEVIEKSRKICKQYLIKRYCLHEV